MTKLQGMYSILTLCEELKIPKNSINEILFNLEKFSLIKEIAKEALIEYKKIIA